MRFNLDISFRDTAASQPAAPAILTAGGKRDLSYADLDRLIDGYSRSFASAGVSTGSTVGIHIASGTNYIAATYAAWRCGACAVPIPVELANPEKLAILRFVAIDFAATATQTVSLFSPFASAPATSIADALSLQPLQRQRDVPQGFFALNPAFVRFTSGTTAAAKGVVLSHETIRDRIDAANEMLRIDASDRVVWLLSMAYHFAVTIVGYLSRGAAIILPSNHFADAILNAAHSHGATLIYGSPGHYAWLAESPNARPLPSLRLAISTTAALRCDVAGRFLERYGLPVSQALGVIEVGLPFINFDAAEHPDSVGRPLPAYQLRLSDTGDDRVKLLALRGPGLFDAYYDPWRPRDAVLDDGWFVTGDLVEVSADGCVFLRGRASDVINVLGTKVFPQEVEAVLIEHPAVSGARVSARPDPRTGDAVHAVVELEPGAAEPSPTALREWCQSRLAAAKVPQSIEFVAGLPRTASGKVLRRAAEAT